MNTIVIQFKENEIEIKIVEPDATVRKTVLIHRGINEDYLYESIRSTIADEVATWLND